MAVRALPGTIGIPLPPPLPDSAGSSPGLGIDEDQPTLHLVGRSEQRLAEALHATDTADEQFTAETVRALRLLALDNLVDIIQLREILQEKDAEIATLSGEVDLWRERALGESAHRRVESQEAQRRERDLVTVLHSELVRNETLSGELAWRRQPWWRRRRPALR